MTYSKSGYENIDFMTFFYVRASKWVQNDPQAQKQLQILKAQVMSFPMIYNMSWYEKVDFLSFFDVWASKMASEWSWGWECTKYDI